MPDKQSYSLDFQPRTLPQLVKEPGRPAKGFIHRGEFRKGTLYSGSDMQNGISVVQGEDGAVWLARRSGVLPPPSIDNSWLLLTHSPKQASMPDPQKAAKVFAAKLESEWERLTASSLVRTINHQTAAVDAWFSNQIETGGFNID